MKYFRIEIVRDHRVSIEAASSTYSHYLSAMVIFILLAEILCSYICNYISRISNIPDIFQTYHIYLFI